MGRVCLLQAFVCDRIHTSGRFRVSPNSELRLIEEMVKTNHGSAAAARRELSEAGFIQAFSPPGTPEKWQFPRRKGSYSTYTVARVDGLPDLIVA